MSKRGFAAMDPVKQRKISRMGGRAVQKSPLVHRWTPDEARKYGALGGRAKANKVKQIGENQNV